MYTETDWKDLLDIAWTAAHDSWYAGDRSQAVQRMLEKLPGVTDDRVRAAFVEVDRLRDTAVEVADDFRDKRLRSQKDALRVLAERCPAFSEPTRGAALQFGLMVTR